MIISMTLSSQDTVNQVFYLMPTALTSTSITWGGTPTKQREEDERRRRKRTRQRPSYAETISRPRAKDARQGHQSASPPSKCCASRRTFAAQAGGRSSRSRACFDPASLRARPRRRRPSPSPMVP